MKAPDKIYIQPNAHDGWFEYNSSDLLVEYIRKDVVDDILKTAEDHAYFAGKEKMREELLKWAYEDLDPAAYLQLNDKLNEM